MDIKIEDIPYSLHTLVDIVGYDDFLEICKMYGGSSVYIPVHSRVVNGQRNREIVREYNGKNIDLLKREGVM